MWLPDWLYRTLPIIYSITGFLCFYLSDNWIGYVSGVLLVTAGLMVWNLRKQYKEVKPVRSRR
jgi:hypothetical protein